MYYAIYLTDSRGRSTRYTGYSNKARAEARVARLVKIFPRCTVTLVQEA